LQGCCLVAVVTVLAGCQQVPVQPTAEAPLAKKASLGSPVQVGAVVPVSFPVADPDDSKVTAGAARSLPALFAGLAELSTDALIEQVLARNPSLVQMIAAWQAAQARYPQVTSLQDPMFAATVGPGTFRPDDSGVEFAYRLEISQHLPFPGKLKLRGDNALAEASAARRDVDDVRLQLIEAARTAFYDYYLVARALEVNADSLKLLKKFRDNAEKRFELGKVPQQDKLQAEVEMGREQERRLGLERMREVAIARLNTLMHLPPDAALPPPPQSVSRPVALPEALALRELAVSRRPDLLALAERIRAEEAQLGLAHKEFYPDFEPFFMYDRFMGNVSDNRDLATMVGLRTNLPAYKARRYGAVAEAEARIAQRRAELAKQTDQVNYQVQEAYEKVRQAQRSVALYEETILPKSKLNIDAAFAEYIAGKISFLPLVQAQRDQVGLRYLYYETLAEYFRRRATLERVIGGPPESLAAPRETLPSPVKR
jgi:outer membrane protein TolC